MPQVKCIFCLETECKTEINHLSLEENQQFASPPIIYSDKKS